MRLDHLFNNDLSNADLRLDTYTGHSQRYADLSIAVNPILLDTDPHNPNQQIYSVQEHGSLLRG